ncbi:MAG: DNA polymerase I, partial [Oscillospiraceae bacterium]|nr:DNA polymerase I [Oscillospiraceae bacterium]
MKLLCFDGNSVANRAFYGIKLLTTKDGKYTNAVYGFMNIFLRAVEEQKPDAVAIAFDLPAPTFRHKMYGQYKANRKGMPQELAEQMPVLKALLTALGYCEVSAVGYEADDILGTLSESCREVGWECVIATGDKDSLQLIDGATKVLLTTTRSGRGETSLVDEAKIGADYGLRPAQLIEMKALMGDNSDNVPGVTGVGEKTALALIREFGSIDSVYENIDSLTIKDGVRNNLIAGKEIAYLSRELVTICKQAPIDRDPLSYKKQYGEPHKAAGILASLEMHSLVKKLGLSESDGAYESAYQAPAIPKIELKELTSQDAEKLQSVCAAVGKDGLLVSQCLNLFRVPEAFEESLLRDAKLKKYCCGLKQLHHYTMDRGGELHGAEFDIELAAYLLNPASTDYSIDRLASEYGALRVFESEADSGLGLFEPLAALLSAKLEEARMSRLLSEVEIPFAGVLAEMEREGFLVDREGIRDFGDMLVGEIDREQEAVFTLVGHSFNLNSPKQLGDALFIDLQLPSGKKTKSGFSTDAEVLDKLRGLHPVIDHILRFRAYGKLNSTYVEGLLKAVDDEGRIHSDFRQTETRTGRISSTNPNLQNIPVRTELGSRMRKFFVAKKGCVLLDADYSQIELRVLASVSSDEKMIDAFLNNRDIHTETASEIFRIPRRLVNPELRRRAKAVNFGIVYGIGAYSLS